jgi:hypothetical protein
VTHSEGAVDPANGAASLTSLWRALLLNARIKAATKRWVIQDKRFMRSLPF